MRLVFICRNCNLLGGQSRIAWELARRALLENHDVHLLARRFPPGEVFGSKGAAQAHHVFQLPKFFGQWRARSFATFSSRRAEQISKGEGVIHGFGDSYRQHIITLGNVDWNYSKYIPNRIPSQIAVHLKTKSFLDPNLKFLVLVSHQMRDALLDLYPDYDMSKVRYIYPGVDVERFSPKHHANIRANLSEKFKIPTNKVWLVSGAGGDFEKRNIVSIGQALLKLKHHPNWVFLFVGGKKEDVEWPKEILNRTFFLGHFNDISVVLPGCDLMIYPAWYDESPLFCLEGMASGLPYVISRFVGTSEIMSPMNRELGLLKDPSNVDELVHLTEQLLVNEDLRKRLGEENHKAVQSFSWDATYRRYKDLYQEALALPIKR